MTLPYAEDDETDSATYRISSIGAHGDVTVESDTDLESDGEGPRELWTHAYVADREPAPYAESLAEETNGDTEEAGCEEIILPQVSETK